MPSKLHTAGGVAIEFEQDENKTELPVMGRRGCMRRPSWVLRLGKVISMRAPSTRLVPRRRRSIFILRTSETSVGVEKLKLFLSKGLPCFLRDITCHSTD